MQGCLAEPFIAFRINAASALADVAFAPAEPAAGRTVARRQP
jgi:hypothetical protein